MRRTRASPYDAYVGVLGELIWARLRYGTITQFDTLHTRGKTDDGNVEIKTSKTRISPNAHLMVREDYALRRAPAYYVLVLIAPDQPPRQERDAVVCGWATHAEVVAQPPRERISNFTRQPQGFRCYEVRAADLHPLSQLPFALAGLSGASDMG